MRVQPKKIVTNSQIQPFNLNKINNSAEILLENVDYLYDWYKEMIWSSKYVKV